MIILVVYPYVIMKNQLFALALLVSGSINIDHSAVATTISQLTESREAAQGLVEALNKHAPIGLACGKSIDQIAILARKEDSVYEIQNVQQGLTVVLDQHGNLHRIEEKTSLFTAVFLAHQLDESQKQQAENTLLNAQKLCGLESN